MSTRIDRRSLLAGISVLLGGCASQGGIPFGSGFGNPAAYGPINDHGHEIPDLDMSRIDPGSASPASRLRQPLSAGHHRRNDRRTASLFRRAGRQGDALHRGRGTRGGAELSRQRGHRKKSGMAPLDADGRYDPPHADLCALHSRIAGRHRQNPLGAQRVFTSTTAAIRGTLTSRLHGTIEPGDDRPEGVEQLSHSLVQSRHCRPLQSSLPRLGRRSS